MHSQVGNNQLKQQVLGARENRWAIFSSCQDNDREDGEQAEVTDGPEVSMSPPSAPPLSEGTATMLRMKKRDALPKGQDSLGTSWQNFLDFGESKSITLGTLNSRQGKVSSIYS